MNRVRWESKDSKLLKKSRKKLLLQNQKAYYHQVKLQMATFTTWKRDGKRDYDYDWLNVA
jgi:hypothetical protein